MFSKETKEIINSLFKDDIEFRDRLLNADVSAIQELGLMNNSINPRFVINAFETNELQKLLDEAKSMEARHSLYHLMVEEYSKRNYSEYNGKRK